MYQKQEKGSIRMAGTQEKKIRRRVKIYHNILKITCPIYELCVSFMEKHGRMWHEMQESRTAGPDEMLSESSWK